MENGAIRRGDAITSSSTPGAGMKATGACKTIGYALEDATEDGTIQVFANTGESIAGEVAALREANDRLQTQVQTQGEELSTLRQQNTTLEARLAAIEQRLNGGHSAAGGCTVAG